MAKYELVSGKELDKLIVTIGGMAKRLTRDLHIACLSAAVHAAEHGNCTPINKLCEIAKDVTHNNAVTRWFGEYCQFVQWDTKEKAFVMNTVFRNAQLKEGGQLADGVLDAYITTTLDTAKTYLEFTPPPAYQPVNVARALRAIIAKADKMTDADKADPRNDLSGLDEVRALLLKVAA